MELAELIEECKKRQAKAFAEWRNTTFILQGEYHLDKLTLEQLNEALKAAWDEQAFKCTESLYILAAKSEDPLIQWIAENVPNKKTAFHLIKRMPMDLEQIDVFARRNKWCAAYYTKHRVEAIEAQVVTEYL